MKARGGEYLLETIKELESDFNSLNITRRIKR